LREQDLNL